LEDVPTRSYERLALIFFVRAGGFRDYKPLAIERAIAPYLHLLVEWAAFAVRLAYLF